MNIHLRTIGAVAAGSTNLVVLMTVQKEDLKNHVDPHHPPSLR